MAKRRERRITVGQWAALGIVVGLVAWGFVMRRPDIPDWAIWVGPAMAGVASAVAWFGGRRDRGRAEPMLTRLRAVARRGRRSARSAAPDAETRAAVDQPPDGKR